MAKAKAKAKDDGAVVIKAANIRLMIVRIRGTAPYVQNKFSNKITVRLMASMAETAAEKQTKPVRPPRDYDADFENAQHKTVAGWVGIPCSGLRAGMIAACRTVNLVMTRAKMALFVLPDGFDAEDGTPLVRLYSALPPRSFPMRVVNDSGGADIRIRPMWREWWADISIEWDADMLTAESVVNLLDRTGKQVGIGEGRPFSKNSVGMGWGTFAVELPAATEEESHDNTGDSDGRHTGTTAGGAVSDRGGESRGLESPTGTGGGGGPDTHTSLPIRVG
jgi:hypothetical protein